MKVPPSRDCRGLSVAGDDLEVPVGARPEVAAMAYAAFVAGIMHRLGGLLAVLTEADPEIAELRATTDAERLTGVGAFVAHLAELGFLRADRPAGRATDACWALTSPQLYAQLTGARGWPQDAYVAWLAGVLGASLLPSYTGGERYPGSERRAVVPATPELSVTVPPWAAAACRAMCRPRPTPGTACWRACRPR